MTYKRLQEGDQAPGFSIRDLNGRDVTLTEYRDRKLLFAFFRYGACPLCNLRMTFLIDAYPRWQEQGLDVIAVFESPAERLLETVASQQIPFPVIPDPERTLYKKYGVTASWLGYLVGAFRFRAFRDAFKRGFHIGKGEGAITQLPAEFLIGPDLKIEHAYYGKDIGDHLPISDIDHWLLSRYGDSARRISRVDPNDGNNVPRTSGNKRGNQHQHSLAQSRRTHASMKGPRVQEVTISDFADRSVLVDGNFGNMETRAVSLEFTRFRMNFEATLELLAEVWDLDPMNGPIPIHSIVYREAFLARLITCMEVYLSEVAKHISRKRQIKHVDKKTLSSCLSNYYSEECVEALVSKDPARTISSLLPKRLSFQQKRNVKAFFRVFGVALPSDLAIGDSWARIFGGESDSYMSKRHSLIHNGGVITTMFVPMDNAYLTNAIQDVVLFVKAVETRTPLLNSFISQSNRRAAERSIRPNKE
jgi:thioredoxin-dependent peroxiredoxin